MEHVNVNAWWHIWYMFKGLMLNCTTPTVERFALAKLSVYVKNPLAYCYTEIVIVLAVIPEEPPFITNVEITFAENSPGNGITKSGTHSAGKKKPRLINSWFYFWNSATNWRKPWIAAYRREHSEKKTNCDSFFCFAFVMYNTRSIKKKTSW